MTIYIEKKCQNWNIETLHQKMLILSLIFQINLTINPLQILMIEIQMEL